MWNPVDETVAEDAPLVEKCFVVEVEGDSRCGMYRFVLAAGAERCLVPSGATFSKRQRCSR